MVISQDTIEKIKKIAKKYHNAILLKYAGKEELTQSEIDELKQAGLYDEDNQQIIKNIYHYNLAYRHGDENAPDSLDDFNETKPELPENEQVEASVDYLTENFETQINKQKDSVVNKLTEAIRNANQNFKFQKLTEDEILNNKDLSVANLKSRLEEISGEADRDWDRIVNTEVSNAISLGSVDRIAGENEEKDSKEVYVYRIPQKDACQSCKKFYMDSDGSPKLYRFSTLLGNGSNFGKKRSEWKPVADATHPNEKCSQVLELKPGFKLETDGTPTYIGREKWENEYIPNKLSG